MGDEMGHSQLPVKLNDPSGWLFQVTEVLFKYPAGSCRFPLFRTVKWRCAPVEQSGLPEFPIKPIVCPSDTGSPPPFRNNSKADAIALLIAPCSANAWARRV